MQDTPQETVNEAAKDIDNILSRLKPVRPPKFTDLQNEVEADEMISSLLQQMKDACTSDLDLNKAGLPALAKLKLLPSTISHLSKYFYYSQKITLVPILFRSKFIGGLSVLVRAFA